MIYAGAFLGRTRTGTTRFDGETFDVEQDQARLAGQLARVFVLMSDGEWRTSDDIKAQIKVATKIDDSEAGISARLRDLRKPRFGSHTVERRRTAPDSGLYEYKVTVNTLKGVK